MPASWEGWRGAPECESGVDRVRLVVLVRFVKMWRVAIRAGVAKQTVVVKVVVSSGTRNKKLADCILSIKLYQRASQGLACYVDFVVVQNSYWFSALGCVHTVLLSHEPINGCCRCSECSGVMNANERLKPWVSAETRIAGAAGATGSSGGVETAVLEINMTR